jgi:phenylpyruvate tautomerase PptA (4-oxalocrotonate tautomerase family)
MPYINLVIASGRDAGTRRRLIAELSNAFTDILESRPQDVHAMLWEVPAENLGEGGAEPGPRQTNNITALVAEGRSPEVLDALVRRCSEVTADVLGVEPDYVHMFLNVIPAARFSSGGVPMKGAGDPRWFTEGRLVPARSLYPAASTAASPHSNE